MAVQMYRFCNMNSGHCQLGRSLERILEEAHLSGELKLSNRKLKDFPKSATKYDLTDTVFADLSRNRFSELPEEITSFAFLETLILYHNTIRAMSDTVKGLSSLTYLDLRSNQLSSLPREICFLPLRVLLIANNRLTVLPEELGRMEKLTELDASCNYLTNLPPRMGDLKNLKSLSLRNNQLVYIPREITTLTLISLNLSSNRISSLPVEIRLMTTLVELNLENNPLTSPPAGLCVRGLVHVFKFLEMQATKDDKSKSCGSYDGYSTLRRTSRSANGTLENNKSKKNQIDSVCIINDGLDKLLSQEALNVPGRNNTTSLPKPSVLMNMQTNGIHLSLRNQKTQMSSNDSGHHVKFSGKIEHKLENSDSCNISNNLNSTLIYEDGYVVDTNKLEDKNKNLGNIQTYKEYKEALKQQRNQEIANLYKTKGHKNVIDEADNIISSNCNNGQEEVSMNFEKGDLSPENKFITTKNGTCFEENAITNKKPVQKVIPSRNTSIQQSLNNENNLEEDNRDDCYKYAKPRSPTKCNGVVSMNTINNTNNAANITKAAAANAKVPPFKSHYKSINWNQDLPTGKLSFTMRREFDKQKEETELIAQLRSIIETRLKMNVPEDIASALMDGVILCHLANHVRPRSVASIHVPSPGVQKLPVPRCRRNVDNFLEACRRIGVDEELICSCEDVISADVSLNDCLPNPTAVFKTISALMTIMNQQQHVKGQLTPATNHQHRTEQNIMMDDHQNGIDNNYNDEVIYENGDGRVENETYTCISVPCSPSAIKKNNKDEMMVKMNGGSDELQMNVTLNKLTDIHDDDDDDNEIKNYSIDGVDNGNYLKYEEILNVNNLNITNSKKISLNEVRKNINVNQEIDTPQKIVTKRIEFFETNKSKFRGESVIFSICKPHSNIGKKNSDLNQQDSIVFTIFLSCVFLLTFLLLIIFPISN